ncbi:hypothetical protein Bca52824_093247 [Brassica carinata]|uniref:PB1 domain-containing protein n=1 Tax=Brassica carinata TaxID=52824 RepID=A0A8X7P2X0_BRACI|nr:hypothetical protein Bca52824_093247 [Brassica carinata]
MSEEEDKRAIKAQGDNEEMTEQDNVMLLTGSWVREDDGKWIFDSLTKEGTKRITMKSGLEYEELLHLVKEALSLGETSVTIKLAYQYPPWMQIDNADGSTPHFISDDHEVEVFVQMRRTIEEVNLFVTVSEPVHGISTEKQRLPYANVTDQILARNENDDESDDEEGFEEEWLDFAMSETSLTCPHQKNDIGGSFGGPPVRSIPNKQNGIVICEPIIRLASPTHRESYRGKGKAIDIGGHSLGCGADVIVPVMSTTKSAYGGNGESSCAVRRRLFDEPLQIGDQGVEMEESGRAKPEPIEGGTITAPTRVAQPSSLYTWTQFQDSLHDLLNDESTEPVLFARDAPPVPHILADGVMLRQQLWDFQGSKILWYTKKLCSIQEYFRAFQMLVV